jgi:hypothetical protein
MIPLNTVQKNHLKVQKIIKPKMNSNQKVIIHKLMKRTIKPTQNIKEKMKLNIMEKTNNS